MLRRGTTPTIRFTFTQVAVANMAVAYLTMKQKGGGITIEKDLTDAVAGENYLEWPLTQEETLQIDEKSMLRIQCRYRLTDGHAYASEIYDVKAREVLKEGVI